MNDEHRFEKLTEAERDLLEDQAAAYAFDALEPEETEEYRRHLVSCFDCRARVEEFQEAVQLIGLSAGELPASPDFRERILARAAAERLGRDRQLLLIFGRPATLLALAATIVIAVLGLWNVRLQSDVANREQALVQLATSGRVVSLNPAASQQAGAAVIIPTTAEPATLVIGALPTIEAGRVYQIWVIRNGRPEGAGVFGVGHRVVPISGSVIGAEAVALTIEPGPQGSQGPTTQPFLVGRIS